MSDSVRQVTKWLADSANQLPGYNTHTVGVGCFVMNQNREVLAVQERSGPASKAASGVDYWKIPTGSDLHGPMQLYP